MTLEDEQVARESELARELLHAPDKERRRNYGRAYDEIYAMHLARRGPSLEEKTFGASTSMLPLLTRLTAPGADVLEVGCGTGLLAIYLARAGRRVTGADVSRVALAEAARHADGHVRLVHLDGVALPFDTESFDLVYTVEVLEHLHERDAEPHLRECFRVVRPGGALWLLTPNARFSGGAQERWSVAVEPDADVHLREWTYMELTRLLRSVGFRRLQSPLRHSGSLTPVGLSVLAERLPRHLATYANAVSVSIIGRKPL
ncbi:MAG TPA: class I SAM-dependent methyltransferase [Gaiellaceae bacterium]|nr:class I SAM-dependent methyltransferase [Gaiellaceae bacterium]